MKYFNSLPIGTIIELPFGKLKVVENAVEGSSPCRKCVLFDMCNFKLTQWLGHCGRYKRDDNKSVYFVEVERKEGDETTE